MYKKILAMIMTVAMLMVMGPVEAFAEGSAAITVTPSNLASTTADIEWTQVDGASSYTVSLDGAAVATQLTGGPYTLTGLNADTTYTVAVTALGSDGASLGEGTGSFTTLPANVPEKVKNFSTVSSYLSVILKWDRSDDADGYRIYWTGSNNTEGTIEIADASKTSYIFKIKEENSEAKYTFKIHAVKDGNESAAVKKTDSAVQLMKLEVTLKINKTLQNHDKPVGKYTVKLKAGTKIKTVGFTNGKYVFRKKVKGKLRTFYVMRFAVKNQKVKYIGSYGKKNGWKIVKPKLAYSKEEAESFVNTLGVKSNTKNLIWVNQYTQRLYVFKGKKGKWKLIKQCYKDEDDGYPGWPVASGKPTSPTSTGLTNIKQRDLGGGGKVPYWNVTSWFSIHGNSPGPWGPLGWPKSGACCRNTTPHAKWIYQNTKMHTAVYVY